MAFDPRELHPDRLSTTDEEGRRVFIYPADVRGFRRKWRIRLQWVLIVFFMVLPWVHHNGKQLLLLDIVNRKFEIFGLTLRAHDVPGLVFVFATLAFGLLFFTSIWGRIWCGWACPQTVFIDAIFRKIETVVEGNYIERKRLDQSPFSVKKAYKKTIKWTLFTLSSALITHSFLAYFVGSKNLISMISSSPTENWQSFLFILVSTGLVLFDFAWFREQFCTLICPYGRLQSVLIDENTQVVGYDFNRGEPRKGSVTPPDKQGDCVNCFRCVNVCPAGIDIRRGIQMECINCTSCMDACDEVMTKVKKPTGLIRFTSEAELNGKSRQRVRPRSVIYGALWAVSAFALVVFIFLQEPIDATWLRARGAPYELVQREGEEEIVLNRFQVELTNKTDHEAHLKFDIIGKNPGVELVTAQNPFDLSADKIDRADVFLKAPRSMFKNGVLKVSVQIQAEDHTCEKELTLVGPFG